MNVGAVIFGFFLDQEDDAYVLFDANGGAGPTFSRVPSMSMIEDSFPFKELAPVGPRSKKPMLVAVTLDGQFKYSRWIPPSRGLTDPSEGFAAWESLDFGHKVQHVSQSCLV